MSTPRPRLLVELRPCLGGHAGVAQETRLLFAALAAGADGAPPVRLGGLLNGGTWVRGADGVDLAAQGRAVAAVETATHAGPLGPLARVLPARLAALAAVLPRAGRAERLGLELDPAAFGDWIWTRHFAPSLPPAAREAVLGAAFPLPAMSGWRAAWLARLHAAARPRLEGPWDLFLSPTPSPYRPGPGLRTAVRFHDAIPVLRPDTVEDPWGQAGALLRHAAANAADGAWFACDSEPVRADLLRLLPAAEARAVVVPVAVSPEFRPEPAPPRVLDAILARRAAGPVAGRLPRRTPMGDAAPEPAPRYVLAVAALEPRKNLPLLFDAVARLHRDAPDRAPLLVVVGNPGWRHAGILATLDAMVRRGEAAHLVDVPADDLRHLYAGAAAVVCPSLAEGFDLPGIEAMACGTPVLASAIPVHAAVHGEAALLFDPHDAPALARLLAAVLAAPREEGRIGQLREAGLRLAARHRSDAVMPAWGALFERMLAAPARLP